MLARHAAANLDDESAACACAAAVLCILRIIASRLTAAVSYNLKFKTRRSKCKRC